MSTETPTVKWNRVLEHSGALPKPRHGHRAVAIKGLIIVFGGGNDGLFEDLHVFNIATEQWFVPAVRGELPLGCAGHGMVCDGTKVIIFGGMQEYGKYTNSLYELQASRWEWKKLKWKIQNYDDVPCPRIVSNFNVPNAGKYEGHSFTYHNSKIYMFGGLANKTGNPKDNQPQYLNDLCVLELKPRTHATSAVWVKPEVKGEPPSPRESHTANLYIPSGDSGDATPLLVIFGGMDGTRLGDLHMLRIGEELTWFKPELSGVGPSARSLHTSALVGDRMYVFGGWTPTVSDLHMTGCDLWSVAKGMSCLNLKTNTWEEVPLDEKEESPAARVGHCAVTVYSRVYIWSGRDGYNKHNGRQVCCRDLWYLETARPDPPSRIQLVQAKETVLQVCWGPVCTAEAYILQIQRYDIPPIEPPAKPNAATAAPPKKVMKIVAKSDSTSSSTAGSTILRLPAAVSSNSGAAISSSIALTLPDGSLKLVPQSITTNSSPKVITLVKQIGNGNVTLTPVTQPGKDMAVTTGTTLISVKPNVVSSMAKFRSPNAQLVQLVSPAQMKPQPVGLTQPGLVRLHTNTAGRQAIVITKSKSKPAVVAVPSEEGETSKELLFAKEEPSEAKGATVEIMDKSAKLVAKDIVIESMDTSTTPATDNTHSIIANTSTITSTTASTTSTTATEDTHTVTANASITSTTTATENTHAITANTSTITSTTTVGGASSKTTAKKYPWRDVAVITGTSALVDQYHVPQPFSGSGTLLANLVPGGAYKLRVAGINTCGRGRWSEVSAFKTSLPYLPGPPVGVKILKHGDGIHISWEAPTVTNGTISEYAVYLAIKDDTADDKSSSSGMRKPQISFGRIYVGVITMCLVSYSALSTGYVDEEKAGLTFRLVAKNANGYGPAVQVRWLQDPTNLHPLHQSGDVEARSKLHREGTQVYSSTTS